MKFFIDTADISEIRELAATGLVDGVTTNPSLIAKTGRPFKDVIKEICEAVDGPVSAEVTATDFGGMMAEGKTLAGIAEPKFFSNGEQVFDGARPVEALILIAMGTVDLTNAPKEVVLMSVGSGQWLGEVAFFNRGPRPVSAVTREATRTLYIPFAKLDELLKARPSLALTFYGNLAREFAKHLGRLAADRDHRYL